jgi:hypothetical protein
MALYPEFYERQDAEKAKKKADNNQSRQLLALTNSPHK